MEHQVYYEVSTDSVVKCVIACSNNPFGTCSRLIWKRKNRLCLLHSMTAFPGSYSKKFYGLFTPYALFVKECSDAGYDYDSYTKTCLKYYELASGGVTWTNARALCQQDGGDLISIQTKAKWNFVANYIGCTFSMWIGLRNKKWVTGENYVNVFGVSDHLNDEDIDYPGDSEQHCGALYADSIATGAAIQDESCNQRSRAQYLCEILSK